MYINSEKMSQLLELCQFLSISQRPDVKDVALQHILGLTASKEGILAIGKYKLYNVHGVSGKTIHSWETKI